LCDPPLYPGGTGIAVEILATPAPSPSPTSTACSTGGGAGSASVSRSRNALSSQRAPQTAAAADDSTCAPSPSPSPIVVPSATPIPTPSPTLVLEQTVSLETPDYPTNAPPYVFEDQGVVAVLNGVEPATASSARSHESIVLPLPAPALPCPAVAFIDAREAGSLVITDIITCPPGSIIDAAYVSTDIYSFNNQTTPAQSLALLEHTCGLSICTARFTISVGSGSSGIYKPIIYFTAHFPNETPETSDKATYSLPVNGQGAVYPQETDSRFADGRMLTFPEPPPPFQSCRARDIPKPPGCSSRDGSFADKLEKYYKSEGWPLAIFSSKSIEAHHIQPLCWGGNNVYQTNGVFLTHAIHIGYSGWWARVIINGTTSSCSDSGD
jgi:hypothetical protein